MYFAATTVDYKISHWVQFYKVGDLITLLRMNIGFANGTSFLSFISFEFFCQILNIHNILPKIKKKKRFGVSAVKRGKNDCYLLSKNWSHRY